MGRGRAGLAMVAVVTLVVVAGLVVVLRRGPSVVLIGDSITDAGQEAFEDRMGHEWRLTISGVGGARSDQRVGGVPELAARHPQQVVVNLGTNDVMQGRAPADAEASIEQVANGFAGARCIHLVTISENMMKPDDPGVHDRAADLNNRIRQLAARHGWDVIPWGEIVAMYEMGPRPEGDITRDTVHPSDFGNRVLADAYERALDACPT